MKTALAFCCAGILTLALASFGHAAAPLAPAASLPHLTTAIDRPASTNGQDGIDTPSVPAGIELADFKAVYADGAIGVQWVTTLELQTFGFHLFRGVDANFANALGITPELVPGQGTNGGTYDFSDTDITEGATYYYWLVEVALDGNTHQTGPISIKAAPGSASTPPDGQPPTAANQLFLPQIVR